METITHYTLTLPVENVVLKGELMIPNNASALVIFSHGSGSSRFSPRNNFVASEFNRSGLATLLIDLQTPNEDAIYENRFNIPLLTSRLKSVTAKFDEPGNLYFTNIGYFGSSTGGASALMAAAEFKKRIYAIVIRGGRPDLAASFLHSVTAPSLLIVGSNDYDVLKLNELAFSQLSCIRDLQVVQDATHLFEEPGALEQVAFLAAQWFNKHLP